MAAGGDAMAMSKEQWAAYLSAKPNKEILRQGVIDGYVRWAEAAPPEGTGQLWDFRPTELPTHDIDWLALNHDFSGGSF